MTVLKRIPYDVYVQISDAWENRHLRMAYHDGTLEIVSPHLHVHEIPSRRLSIVITVVAEHCGLSFEGAGASTFRRRGEGPYRGMGKEPDQCFYFENVGRLPRDREVDLDAGDPPPDLWIEIDNRSTSKGRLPIYAALGVPEVWRYRANRKTLEFLRRNGPAFEPIDRSISVPVLTATLVLEALALGENRFESEWLPLLRDWVARTIPAGQG